MNLKDTIILESKIIEIKRLKNGETVGYDRIYKAKCNEIIGIVSIVYVDGVNRKMKGHMFK